MAKYALTEFPDVIERTADGYRFPMLPNDSEFIAYEAWVTAGGVPDAGPPKTSLLSQDLIAQFTASDLTTIKTTIDASIQFWGLWSALQAQKDPMIVTNDRFLKGWRALVSVLGQPRMDEIATALGITVTP